MEDSDDECFTKETNIGYYSTLNLNYFSTDEDIKRFSLPVISHSKEIRNFNELYERYNTLYEKETLVPGKIPENPPKRQASFTNLKELIEKIYISYSVLEDRLVNFSFSLLWKLFVLIEPIRIPPYARNSVFSFTAKQFGTLQGKIL